MGRYKVLGARYTVWQLRPKSLAKKPGPWSERAEVEMKTRSSCKVEGARERQKHDGKP